MERHLGPGDGTTTPSKSAHLGWRILSEPERTGRSGLDIPTLGRPVLHHLARASVAVVAASIPSAGTLMP